MSSGGWAVITGAGTGIGAALAKELARRGFKVNACSLPEVYANLVYDVIVVVSCYEKIFAFELIVYPSPFVSHLNLFFIFFSRS